MMLILKSFEGNYVVTYVISFFLFSAWEYFVGWLLERFFHTKYWDYSFYKTSINGRICLVNSLTWGFMGVAFTEIIHPIISYIVSFVPVEIINISTPIMLVILLIDIFITIIKINDINVNMKKLSEITANIKEKIAELKESPRKATKNEKIKNSIKELKQKQTDLKEKIEKQTQRLRDAFPKMNSEFKKKIELKIKNKKKN